MMMHLARYGRILLRFWKNALIREMSFRAHFIVQVGGELLWIAMMLIFIKVIFRNTGNVRGWTEGQYLFLMGTHMIVTGIFETFFFSNCWRVSHLVRTGDLDFVLVRPASAQFLLSFERIDYTSLTKLPVAVALCLYAASSEGRAITLNHVLLFIPLIAAGVIMLYSLLFMFAVTSVWLIRQTSVNHLWFYAVNLARYPAEIYQRFAGGALWFGLVFVVPILLVANLPANVMMRTFEPTMVAYFFGASLVLLVLSTFVLRLALRSYRSASS